ncbi:hypothetical protein ACFQ3Z_26895 [Streptomyces nogalater]
MDGRDELTLRMQLPEDRTGLRLDEGEITRAVENRLGVPLRFEYGPLGSVTTTGAMVSWKAARVEDRRQTVPDAERAAALAVASGRAQ